MTLFHSRDVDEIDARLVRKDKNVAEQGFVLIRSWNYLDAAYADTLSTTMDAVATVVNPKADNQTYTGTFVNSSIRLEEPDPENGERYCNIINTLILVGQVPVDAGGQETADALKALTYRITQENEILQPFALTTGEGDFAAFEWTNLDPTDRANAMAAPDADLVSQIAAVDLVGTWTYVDRKFEQLKDNTGRFTVVFKKVAWNAWSEASPDNTEKQREDTEHERLVETWYKVQESDLATIQSEVYTDDTDYNVMEVSIRENADGSLRVQRTQWHEAFGVNNTELEADQDTTLQPFALQTGTRNRIIIINEALKSRASAYSTLRSTATGYTLIDTREEFRPDGLWNKYYTYEKVTWNAFSQGSPDLTEKQNEGTEHERQVENWFAINNDDALTGLYTHGSDYNSMRVNIRERNDGAIDVTRERWHEAFGGSGTELEQIGQDKINPHGFQAGTLDRIEVVNEALRSKATAYGTPSDVSYTAVSVREQLRPDGLWNKYYVFENPTWSNTSGAGADKVIDTRVVFGHRNYDPDAATEGLNYQKIDGGDGVPNADAVVIFGNETADNGFSVDSVEMTERPNGEISIRKVQTKQRAKTDDITTQFQTDEGKLQETETITWYNLTAADATLVYDDATANKADMAGATYTAASASHVLSTVSRRPQPNGLITVVRVTYVPRGRTTVRFQTEDINPFKVYGEVFKDEYGTPTAYVVTEIRRVTTSVGSAETHIDAGSTHPFTGHALSWMTYNDAYGVYIAMRVNIVAGTELDP